MSENAIKPVVVIVRDGWGANPNPEHDAFNAVKLASTPCSDTLTKNYPTALIKTSSGDVGLPDGTMGNSEVGHQNIGAGRVVDQESVAITKAIAGGAFFENAVALEAVEKAKASGGTVHLMGLVSDAGVHARLDHLYGWLELCKRRGQDRVAIHAFTDGRDDGPFTGKGYLADVEARCAELGVGRIVSMAGRYYAMDRDNRWERVKSVYDLLTGRGEAAPHFATAAEAIQDYYDNPNGPSQNGDEFVLPRTVGDDVAGTRIRDGDTVVFYNYRGDRPRELTHAFVLDEFYGHAAPSPDSGEKGFDRGDKLDLFYVTMTAYEVVLNDFVNVAFPKPPKMKDICGAWLAKHGLRQFRCAETEKFPHVTFFFNDYRDEPFEGEERAIVQSPKVATYDLQPEMSAEGVCQATLDALDQDFAMLVVNFANGDMVGHTGDLRAAIKAVEKVDECVGRIVEKALSKGGSLVVTADHGNAEQMFNPETDAAHTAHTLYDVDCIVVSEDLKGSGVKLREGGSLADVVPTALELIGLEQPEAMTGVSLLEGVRS
ncbi:MAG: 2,3-bisphosphoglycerate-independent phosphoglycerate mutase [Planctomycetota bacterium]|jgi:2,3-bisphosphoglycerate-independent phosphoglycerate mutase